MRFSGPITGVVLFLASLIALPGCGSPSPANNPAEKPAAGHFEGDGHDHSKDSGDHKDHDHAESEHK